MIEINLLPWREKANHQNYFKQGVETVVAFLLAMTILTSLYFVLNSQLKIRRTKILQLQNELVKVNKDLETVKQFHQAVDYQKLPDMDFNALAQHQRRILHFLRKLPEWLPREMRLQRLEYDDKSWLLEGFSPLMFDIVHFAVFGKEKYLKITKKNGLFYYQLRLEIVE